MNVIEYLLKKGNKKVHEDEGGNVYMRHDMETLSDLEALAGVVYISKFDAYMIPKVFYNKYLKIEIVIADDDSLDEIEYVRRPYYRMRGETVTKEQAFDIIRRTDNFFRSYIYEISVHPDYIGCLNFDNWLITKNHYPYGYGWIHVDGTVGANGITQKYPDINEFIMEWAGMLAEFPYLNLIIAVTCWDEVPEEVWFNDDKKNLFKTVAYDEKFYDAILLGIYVHDNKIEILNKQDAKEKYMEYDNLYGSPREIFEPDYYDNKKINQVDGAYLIRCIEAYGLNADEELEKNSNAELFCKL